MYELRRKVHQKVFFFWIQYKRNCQSNIIFVKSQKVIQNKIQGPQSQTRPFDFEFMSAWKEIFHIMRPFSDTWPKHNLVETNFEAMD